MISNPPPEHGNCPHCGVSLDGGGIWQYFFDKTGHEEDADGIAQKYGATRDKGRWGREIGIEENDQVRRWKCPDCGGEWGR